MAYRSGRHFLQIPGPTNVPDRVLRAMDRATIDHRGPDFTRLTAEVLKGLQAVFQTTEPVVVFPSSGTGAWEAALANTLSPGDTVLMTDTGFFAGLWRGLAGRLGLQVELLPGDWRFGVTVGDIQSRLQRDKPHEIKAVCVVHNETSTGVTNPVAAVRSAIDDAQHPALLMVDTISSLGSIDYRHDAWGVDVTVGGSQKGLMLPPGLGFNALSAKAMQVNKVAGLPRSYWDWQPMLSANAQGSFPYTPATNMLFGLQEALSMLREEGLPQVFARHKRLAEATRRAVRGWDLEIFCRQQGAQSHSLTGVCMPADFDADSLRNTILEQFDMSLGAGLGPLKGSMFRIGHLGDFNELMLAATLSGVEMGLKLTKVPHHTGGVIAALDYLTATADGH